MNAEFAFHIIIHQGLAEVFSVFIVKNFSYFIDNVIFLSYSSVSRTNRVPNITNHTYKSFRGKKSLLTAKAFISMIGNIRYPIC